MYKVFIDQKPVVFIDKDELSTEIIVEESEERLKSRRLETVAEKGFD